MTDIVGLRYSCVVQKSKYTFQGDGGLDCEEGGHLGPRRGLQHLPRQSHERPGTIAPLYCRIYKKKIASKIRQIQDDKFARQIILWRGSQHIGK